MTILRTRRLSLRLPEPGDLDAYATIFGDERAMRHYPRPWTRAEVAQRLDAWVSSWRDNGFGHFSAIETASGVMIGRIGLALLDGGPEVEVGWNLHPDVWGRGLAPEGARAVLAFGFELEGLDRIVAVTRPGNIPSVRVMEKIGLRPDGTGVYYGERQVRYVLDKGTWEALPR